MSDCSGMINKICLSKLSSGIYMHVFHDQSRAGFLKAVSGVKFLPICFETVVL